MSVQIIDSGISIKIVTNTIPKFVTKSNILTVEVLIGTIIKIDIGKGALYNIYVDQAAVSSPASVSASDLRDQIHAMLQPSGGGSSSGGATEANQLLQTTALQNIKTSIDNLNEKVNLVNDKVFYQVTLVDETNGNIIYNGFAAPGTSPTSANWAIQRVTNDAGNLSYNWAGGNKNFDKRWDMRASLSYS